jgi:hypothetical protein
MNSYEHIIYVCNSYKQGKFDIDEFQKRLETVFLPDTCKNTLEIIQHNAWNRLEKIQFSQLPKDQKRYADQVADELIHATVLEQNKQ